MPTSTLAGCSPGRRGAPRRNAAQPPHQQGGWVHGRTGRTHLPGGVGRGGGCPKGGWRPRRRADGVGVAWADATEPTEGGPARRTVAHRRDHRRPCRLVALRRRPALQASRRRSAEALPNDPGPAVHPREEISSVWVITWCAGTHTSPSDHGSSTTIRLVHAPTRPADDTEASRTLRLDHSTISLDTLDAQRWKNTSTS